MTDRHVIDTEAEYLDAVAQIFNGHGPVAVDAERASGYRYSQRAYLIQVFRRGAGVFLFDPPAIGRFDVLNEAIRDEEWIIHAASQDLACLREVGLDPTRVFDTELAGRLLGLHRVGLGAVVEELLGIHLAKEHSAADWSTRPLPETWLEYAALDVELLVDVRDKLDEMLVESGKEQIAREEFEATRMRQPKASRQDPWRRLSGLHGVRGARNLAVARELWTARDALARERDVAPGRLVPDASLVAVVKAQPRSSAALAALRDFKGRASRTDLSVWWNAVERGLTTDDPPPLRPAASDVLPPARAWSERNPEADARLKAARTSLTLVAESLSIPLENVLTPETLRRVAWTPPEPLSVEAVGDALRELGARAWQIEATVQTIVDAFVEGDQKASELQKSES
ncbi:HRDC domain-containing protein [Mycetocola zhadangensis]|uniref:Ribonuclease D n=1 Tax=Mycetocola zhadangensis TaxID=1164595 RepID=A0A3L7J617_9MICO|nr:ribonuclease D [Mycetocola zhadangensis]RLQ86073.1 ribonuclease D [Mycetocola zhadangensis]GGE88163.1 3'-5' exonuclease [Mycetocola zhadangensis]